MQTEADGSRKMAEPALEAVYFRQKFSPGPVGFSDILPRNHHGPQICCHPPHGPDEARNGRRREMAESVGIRRKPTDAGKWKKWH